MGLDWPLQLHYPQNGIGFSRQPHIYSRDRKEQYVDSHQQSLHSDLHIPTEQHAHRLLADAHYSQHLISEQNQEHYNCVRGRKHRDQQQLLLRLVLPQFGKQNSLFVKARDLRALLRRVDQWHQLHWLL